MLTVYFAATRIQYKHSARIFAALVEFYQLHLQNYKILSDKIQYKHSARIFAALVEFYQLHLQNYKILSDKIL